jgi:hypothetical protein
MNTPLQRSLEGQENAESLSAFNWHIEYMSTKQLEPQFTDMRRGGEFETAVKRKSRDAWKQNIGIFQSLHREAAN